MPPHRSRTASSNQSHGWSDAPLAAHAPSRSTRLSIHDSVDATLGARNAIGEKGRRHYDFPGIVSSEKIPPRERVRSLLRARIHSPYRPLCLVHFKSCAHIVDGNKASRLPVETDAPREGSIAGATRHLQRAHHVKLASHELKHALGEPSFASYSQHQRGHGKPPVAAGWNGRTNDPPPPDRRAASTLSSSASQAALLLRRLPAHPIDPCAKCRGSKRARLAAFCAHTACQLKKKGRADHSGRHGIMKKGVGGSEIAAGSTRHSHPSPPLGIGEHQHSFAALCGPHHDLSAMLTPAHQVDLHQRATRAFPFRFSQPTLRAHKAMGGRGKSHCDFARNAMLQTRLTAASTRHSPLAALAHLLRSRGQLKPFFAARASLLPHTLPGGKKKRGTPLILQRLGLMSFASASTAQATAEPRLELAPDLHIALQDSRASRSAHTPPMFRKDEPLAAVMVSLKKSRFSAGAIATGRSVGNASSRPARKRRDRAAFARSVSWPDPPRSSFSKSAPPACST